MLPKKQIGQHQIHFILDNSIFDLSDSLSNNKMSSRQLKKMNNNDKWFNEGCNNLRKKYRNLFNQNRDPET